MMPVEQALPTVAMRPLPKTDKINRLLAIRPAQIREAICADIPEFFSNFFLNVSYILKVFRTYFHVRRIFENFICSYFPFCVCSPNGKDLGIVKIYKNSLCRKVLWPKSWKQPSFISKFSTDLANYKTFDIGAKKTSCTFLEAILTVKKPRLFSGWKSLKY